MQARGLGNLEQQQPAPKLEKWERRYEGSTGEAGTLPSVLCTIFFLLHFIQFFDKIQCINYI